MHAGEVCLSSVPCFLLPNSFIIRLRSPRSLGLKFILKSRKVSGSFCIIPTLHKENFMLRVILGIVAGFIAWSILWVGSDQVIQMLSPAWYGVHQTAFERAMFNKSEFAADQTILIMHLVRSVIFSIMAGYLAAFIANGNRNAPLGLGILLLAFGIMIQVMAWNYLPLWYHVIFLGLLLPMTILGGRLKTS